MKCEESDCKLRQCVEKPQKQMAVLEEDANCVVMHNTDVHNAIKSEEQSSAEQIVKDQNTDLISSLLQTQNKDTKEDIKLGKLMLYTFNTSRIQWI